MARALLIQRRPPAILLSVHGLKRKAAEFVAMVAPGLSVLRLDEPTWPGRTVPA